MKDELSIGDIVELKSGGPPMTVREIESDTVTCIWFDDRHQLQESAFDLLLIRDAIGIGSYGFSRRRKRPEESPTDSDDDIPF